MKINHTHNPQTLICQSSVWLAVLLVTAFSAIIGAGFTSVRAGTTTLEFSLNTSSPGAYISPLVNGISEEVNSTAISNGNWNATGYFWAATNTQIVTLFSNVDFKSMRMGGNTADGNGQPQLQAISNYFTFAQAANLYVTWALGMSNDTTLGTLAFTNVDRTNAEFIANNYSANMLSFAIGNERDAISAPGYGTNWTAFQEFWPAWDTYYKDIINDPNISAGNLPGFSGPDGVIGRPWWCQWFAQTNNTLNNNVFDITYHYEPCGAVGSDSEYVACEDMLSSNVDCDDYPGVATALVGNASGYGMNAGLTEFNPFNTDGGTIVATCNTFGVGIFALDALHWWAQNGLLDLHWHSGLGPGFHCAFYYDANGTLQAYPLLYGCKAFDVSSEGNGSQSSSFPLTGTGYGRVISVKNWHNDGNVNITAYAVGDYGADGKCTNLYVTLINKTMQSFTTTATNVTVTFTNEMPYPGITSMHVMYLTQSLGDVTATNGVTLGGDVLTGTNSWNGQWVNLGVLNFPYYRTTVTNMTAVILKFSDANN